MALAPHRLAGPLLGLAVLVAGTPASSQAPAFLVEDLETGAAQAQSSVPGGFVQLTDQVLFFTGAQLDNRELWKTDGTSAGTALLKRFSGVDLNSLVSSGLAFFVAEDAGGSGVWRSDGTLAGTWKLVGFPGNPTFVAPSLRVASGELVYFTRNGSGPRPDELWRSDGTTEGTFLLTTAPSIGVLADVDGTLFFAEDDGVLGNELWKSDGTPEGTIRVADVQPGEGDGIRIDAQIFASLGGLLIFDGDDGASGLELWRSDGTAGGTLRVKDIRSGPPSSTPVGFTALGDRLFFVATNGSFPEAGSELWTTDGTEDGTFLVKDIRPGASSNPQQLIDVGGTLFFSADDGAVGRELWKSDGTAAGTVLVKDVRVGPDSSGPDLFSAADGLLYFAANDGVTGPEVWRSDGTPAGTAVVGEIEPGDQGNTPFPGAILPADGPVFFVVRESSSARLWTTDGTPAGTLELVADIDPRFPVAIESALFFGASEPATGQELWRSDGTPAGTSLLANLASDAPSSNPVDLAAAKRLAFRGTSSGSDALFGSGGTAASTELLTELDLSTDFFLEMGEFRLSPWRGELVFRNARELWRTDGTRGGTAGFLLGPGGSVPRSPTALGDLLFFAARSGFVDTLYVSDGGPPLGLVGIGTGIVVPGIVDLVAAGERVFFSVWGGLWVSDGTVGGTFELGAGFAGGTIGDLTASGDRLFFNASDNETGQELWTSDGTPTGTLRVADIRPGAEGSLAAPAVLPPRPPSRFAPVEDVLYFAADDGAAGAELWRSDGRTEGTARVKDIAPGPDGSYPTELVNVAGTLYFAADDGGTGRELWRSDGTALGTVRVADLVPGRAGSDPEDLVAAGGVVLFSARTEDAGRELWGSDGTAVGTRRLADVAPGAGSSDPQPFYDRRLGRVFFAADGGGVGRELWALPVAEVIGCRDGFDNDGDGWVDFPDDPACVDGGSLSETAQCQNGVDDDDDGRIDFDGGASIHGAPLAQPDPQCQGRASRSECGLGAELALLLPPLLWLYRRRRLS